MIGIGSPAFCLQPFDDALERVSRSFDLWEILSEGEDRLDLIEDKVRRGRESFGMSYQVHAPLSDVNIGSVHEPMRQAALGEIKKTISMCNKLDIEVMTLHPGFVQGIAFLEKARAVERTRKSLEELEEWASDRSVRIAFENMPANINATCTSPEELLQVIDGLHVGICFDLGHANTAHNIDGFLAHADRFANVHLHNNSGQWDEHNVVDDGTADLEKVMRILKATYRGNLIVESTDLESGVASKAKVEALLR